MPATTLLPMEALTIPEGDNNRFILFGNQWLILQNYIEQALALPINEGAWTDKYGSFADEAAVRDALGAMTRVNKLSKDFGSPHLVKQQLSENPAYLLQATPPDEIYAHIVWLSGQIQNTAKTFETYLTPSTLWRLLDPSNTPDAAKRAGHLTQILTGHGGLSSKADAMKNRTADLVQKLAHFDEAMMAANKDLLTYAGKESEVLARAGESLGSLNKNIETLQQQAAKAEEEWRNYSIAAVSTSVGLVVISGGLLLPFAAGAAGVLGGAAVMAQEEYNRLMATIEGEGTEVKKKARLLTDLKGLNSRVALVTPAMSSFLETLQKIEGVWLEVSISLANIARDYSVEQLSDYAWVLQAFEIEDAVAKWRDIRLATKEFTMNSLVSYHFDVAWGEKIQNKAA